MQVMQNRVYYVIICVNTLKKLFLLHVQGHYLRKKALRYLGTTQVLPRYHLEHSKIGI